MNFQKLLYVVIMFNNISCTQSQHLQSQALTEAIKEIQNSFLNSVIKKEFIKEITSINETSNPSINRDIDYIIVLSGRASYLKRSVDSENVIDIDDDFNRMNLGMEIARNITALRINKEIINIDEQDIEQFGPKIIYNGRPQHNSDLKEALGKKILSNYPSDKFIILELPQDQMHTLGQIITIRKYFAKEKYIPKNLALVTSAYHFSRIGRMFNRTEHDYFNGSNIYIHLTDRKFEANNVQKELVSEVKKIPIYIDQGNLNVNIDNKFIYKDENIRISR